MRKSYNPVNVASVRRFDQARAIGATKLEAADQDPAGKVTLTSLAMLLKSRSKNTSTVLSGPPMEVGHDFLPKSAPRVRADHLAGIAPLLSDTRAVKPHKPL
ncbi:hypothetical protein [Bradyrhizobium sp. BR 1433]|uniref:hypothetical protein n=1 Tax=Bradyrhizobium sp. BR 1433 TaxID=3447967 RepID=UPI003EE65A0E